MASISDNVMPLPYAYRHPVDLTAMCRDTGVPTPVTAMPSSRDAWRLPVIEHPGSPRPVDQGAVAPAVFVDGIQSRRLLGVREFPIVLLGEKRPVFMDYAGAASVTDDGVLCEHADRWWVCASTVDGPWAAGLADAPPVWLLGETLAETIIQVADRLLENTRVALEDHVVASTDIPDGGLLVMDGSIRFRQPRRRLVGVVKSVGTRLAIDETDARTLEVGHRTQMFTVLSGTIARPDVHTCYVRLHEPSGCDWTEGLVRVEAFDPTLLDVAAATAYFHRQPPWSDDPRRACHLAPVRFVEQVAGTRRPPIYDVT